MTGEPTEKLGLPDLPRAISLVVLACISGFTVWSFHHASWPGFIAALVIGGFLGFMAGGLVGVHLFPTLAAMVTFGAIFEGVVQGWSRYGLIGAVLGGFAGLVAGSIVATLPILLIHLVLGACGIDPFINPNSSHEKTSGPPD